MPYCRCGNEFPEAGQGLVSTTASNAAKKEAAAEIVRRAHMIAQSATSRATLSGLGQRDTTSALVVLRRRALAESAADGLVSNGSGRLPLPSFSR
jgi:hypothetical protein